MNQLPNLGELYGATSETQTFLGLESCRDLTDLRAPVAILGVPGATPYRSVGAYCRNGPAALRKATAALAFNLDRHDFESGGPMFPEAARRPVDCGDVAFHETDAASNRDAVTDAVAAICRAGAIPVLLGSDDSIPIPMLRALGKQASGRRFTILQVDAHIDWRDIHLDERDGLSSTMRRASEMGHVERIVQVGARGIGTASTSDYLAAVKWGVHFVPAVDLHRRGVEPVLELIPQGSEIIICFDADALDPSIMPAVIGRAPGGLSYFQAVDLIAGAARRGRIAAMDFVEFMPERDVDGLGAFTLARLIATALGIAVRQADQ